MAFRYKLHAASVSDPIARSRRMHRFSSRPTEYVRLGSLDFNHDSIEGLLRARPGFLPAMRETMPAVPPRMGSHVVLPPSPPPPPFVPRTSVPASSTATVTATELSVEVREDGNGKITEGPGAVKTTQRTATRSASALASGASTSAKATADANPGAATAPMTRTGAETATAAAFNFSGYASCVGPHPGRG